MVVIDAELLSVLRRLVLAGKLENGDALQALATAHQLGLRRYPSRALWIRAWDLRPNLSAYDALYVALAEQAFILMVSSLVASIEACARLQRPFSPRATVRFSSR